MSPQRTQIIVTLGPATLSEDALRIIKEKGVAFVRLNMSHSSVDDLEHALALSRKVGVPFVIDTEGSQIRTGVLDRPNVVLDDNDRVMLSGDDAVGTASRLTLRPGHVLSQLDPGDLVYIDFDSAILRVTDVSSLPRGYITARVVSGGSIGHNKAVAVDPVFAKRLQLPALSPKDHQSIQLGLEAGVGHIAVSFVRSAAAIDEVREVTQGRMKIISKVECIDALERIDEIVDRTDFLLIDRGDLSKEIPIERIPFTQKLIIGKARRRGVGVFVATNLLETMIEKRSPTRAEVHDVINTIADGATGLTLAAETAVGRYPMTCINVLNKLIRHAEAVLGDRTTEPRELPFITHLEATEYLRSTVSDALVPPHGGRLVNRMVTDPPDAAALASLPTLRLDEDKLMDVEQIAIGTYSPLTGFMGPDDFASVLDRMRLADDVVWPLPVVLDVDPRTAERFAPGEVLGLTNERDEVVALLHLREKYGFDKDEMARKIYGTTSADHPGVRMVQAMGSVLLAGDVDLIRGRDSETRAYELSPRQLRRLFEERGWMTVLGFHTRNVPHRGHEFMQREAMASAHCDGLLVHPVVGKKKAGDFKAAYILKSYEKLIETVYPKDRVVLAAFSTFSRYAGPREAVFTALCRKNFGCSHFIVGRDHTGVGQFYDPYASHRVFDEGLDLGITIVKFNEISYSRRLDRYVQGDAPQADGDDRLPVISGSEARAMFQRREAPPGWFMRPEISAVVLDAIRTGERVFEESV